VDSPERPGAAGAPVLSGHGAPDDLESRVAALEARMGQIAADAQVARQDAATARHLAAARDRDIADPAVKVDANRSAINALGEQTRERFDALERKVDDGFRKVDDGFVEMRAKFDMTAAGLERIANLVEQRSEAG
jgi:hypothetical protein